MPSAPAALPPGAVVGSGLAVPVRASCTACTAARRRCDPSPIPGAACLRCERNGLPAEGCVFLPPKRRGRRPGKRRGAKKEDSESPASPASPSSPPAAEIAAPSPPPPPAWATPMLAQALAWPAEFGAPNPAWPQPVSPPLPLSPPSSVDLELAPPDLVMSRYLASTYAALPLTVAAELRRELAARAVPDFLAWSILLWTAWTDGPLRAALGSRRGPLLTVMAARAQDALLPAAQAVLAGPPAAPPIPGVGEPAWIAPPAVRAWLSYRELAVAVVSALLHLGGVAMALRGDGPLASGPVVALAVRIARVACMTDGSFYAGRTDVVADDEADPHAPARGARQAVRAALSAPGRVGARGIPARRRGPRGEGGRRGEGDAGDAQAGAGGGGGSGGSVGGTVGGGMWRGLTCVGSDWRCQGLARGRVFWEVPEGSPGFPRTPLTRHLARPGLYKPIEQSCSSNV
ncbi:hypothetical protein DFJ74DRAFT_37745 [Hyaloraphidium curvatum]|nr:hypothetical protein DFJ74DRAFT_37745 [Hyaloraphidium curvatum]